MKFFWSLIFIVCSTGVFSQVNNIAQFAVWKPKEGLAQKFEDGYKQHLLWHKSNGDTWNWYGWYVISGSRYGYFIDATFDHTWNDFNNPVKPAADRADNALHTVPFGDLITAFKVMKLPELSFSDSIGLQSKLLRLIKLTVNDIPGAIKVLEKLKTNYASQGTIKNFQTYKMVDGGNINQLILLIGFNDYIAYGKAEHLQEDINAIENSLKVKVITAINSETLLYKPDMSLLLN
jgi:hypothetical protein